MPLTENDVEVDIHLRSPDEARPFLKKCCEVGPVPTHDLFCPDEISKDRLLAGSDVELDIRFTSFGARDCWMMHVRFKRATTKDTTKRGLSRVAMERERLTSYL